MKEAMKKSYLTPSAAIIRIQTAAIIAGSETMGIDKSDANGVSNVNDVLSRECDFFEEEE
jgi:hypothetical protein